MVARAHIFNVVFPSSTKESALTPSSTPQLGSAPFGGGSSFAYPDPEHLCVEDRATERIRWERAWHSATAFLSLRHAPVSTVDDVEDDELLRRQYFKSCSPEISSSIRYLVSERNRGGRLLAGRQEDSLVDWYSQEVGRNYIQYQLPQIHKILSHNEEPDLLSNVLRVLQILQAIYFHPFEKHILPVIPGDGNYDFTKFQEGYDAMVATSLSQTRFARLLSLFFKRQGAIVLGLDAANPPQNDHDAMELDRQSLITEARAKTFKVIRCVAKVGLGGAKAQRAFAEVMSGLLTSHVNTKYAGQWSSPSTITNQLGEWVENQFARFAVEVLACLRRHKSTESGKLIDITHMDLWNWKQRAICDLGALRLKELFDIVVDWDNGSRGAVEDLKQYITTTAARSHLTNTFSTVISHRLLQAGASTTQILQVYICIIRAFAVLDPKGVLLDRLARPIRRYLRDRDDTAKIIVSGLLADVTEDTGASDALVELAVELSKATTAAEDDDDGELDWDDMNWVPDPVDAGPEYKKSKSHDVIGTLVSLFDTKDVFVKEFQNVLSERLLSPTSNFERETRVLELLKIRFGASPLQACEVMLKDIHESRRTDAVIHKNNALSPLDATQTIHSKILSRLFWPSLNIETFALPSDILLLQSHYATAFEVIKPTRKLTFLPALGLATVELHLEDRTITEAVTSWQASVIHAFQNPNADDDSSTPVFKTVAQLTTSLSMSEALVLNALTFWISKLVLRETSPGTYTVLETLSDADLNATNSNGINQASIAAAAATSAAAASGGAALQSAEEAAMEKMEEFWPYVVGMLTNQGAMPVQKMVMMLKFVVPGFSFGVEEVREFMRGKVEEGKCVMVGGAYKIVK